MRTFAIAILCAILSVGTAAGNEPGEWGAFVPPVFRHITQADGLPYPVALGVVQDARGFIWVATPGGAGRWDGQRMRVYRHDDDAPGSIPDNILTNALSDESGHVWFGTASGIVARYDDITDTFQTYRRPQGNLGRPNGMASDGHGGILVAGRQGLFHLEVKTGRWSQVEGLPEGDISSVMVDRQGRLWAGTAKGLFWRDAGRTEFTFIPVPTGLRLAPISAIYQDGDGQIWFGTRLGRVGKVSADLSALRVEKTILGTGYRVTSFTEPRPGTLWISEYGSGIHELTRDKPVRHFTHDATKPSSLADNAVTSLLKDRSGLIWASSLRGVHRYIPNNRQIVTLVEGDYGLPGKDVRSVASAADGKAWLGFRGSSNLASLDPYTSFIDQELTARWPKSHSLGLVQALADTGDGRIWIGQPSGLMVIDINQGHAKPYDALKGWNVLALHQAGGVLWVGGSMGLARVPLDGGEPRRFRTRLNDDRSLSDNTVSAVFQDAAGRLWIGTMRGLNRLDDVQSGRFTRYLNNPEDMSSLPSDIVNGITQDRDGFLWLATGNGVARFSPDTDGKITFERIGTREGLRTGTVLSVIEAEDGSILAGSGDGLSAIDRQTTSVRSLGPTEGVEIRTFWAGAASRLRDGTAILGGFGGLVMVHPSPLPVWNYDPPLVLTSLRVANRQIPPAPDVTLQPDDHSIQVEFAALDYAAPERIHYSYRLDAGEWMAAEAHQRTATYTGLPPGTHELVIRATNSSGQWTKTPLRLTITVLPAWHQTPVFHLAVFTLAVGVLIAAFHMRKLTHLRRERALTREVEIRTYEAEAAKLRALAGEEEARRAKEAAEKADQDKSRFLAIIGHEIRTPLNGLLGMLHLLEPTGLNTGSHETLTTAKKAGETLRHLVESVLEFGRQGADSPEPALADVDAGALVTQVVELLRPHAVAKAIDLELRVPPDPEDTLVKAAPASLSRILLNLIGNAIKFTDQGMVTVEMTLEQHMTEHMLTITVNDTGIGVPADMRDAIFSEFTQADDSITRRYGGVGLGLAICRGLAEEMGGKLTLAPPSGIGSCFVLELPVAVGRAGTPRDIAPPLTNAVKHVLVVDDDIINRHVAERMLTRLGISVVTVSSGQEALAAVTHSVFDLILMDLRMPDMDGLETARHILRTTHDARIVAMTAEHADAVWEECKSVGMDGRLLKPIDHERLVEVLSGRASPPAAPLRTGPIDVDHLNRVVEALGPAETTALARSFARVSRQTLQQLEEAHDHSDPKSLEALSHRLRSSAGPLGLIEVAMLARRLEAEAPTSSWPQVQSRIGALKEARMAGLLALKAFARQPRGGGLH